jgi:hypothetical protein
LPGWHDPPTLWAVPIGAVEEHQPLLWPDRQPAGIHNAAIVTEGAERLAVAIEGKQRAVSISVNARCARNKQRHNKSLPHFLGASRICTDAKPILPEALSARATVFPMKELREE